MYLEKGKKFHLFGNKTGVKGLIYFGWNSTTGHTIVNRISEDLSRVGKARAEILLPCE